MKYLLYVLVLLFVPPASASTISGYYLLKKADTTLSDWYIRGIGEGLMSANALANHQGAPIYCQPGNLELTSGNYHQILEDQIKFMSELKEFSGKRSELETRPVSWALMFGLMRTFPCKGKN